MAFYVLTQDNCLCAEVKKLRYKITFYFRTFSSFVFVLLLLYMFFFFSWQKLSLTSFPCYLAKMQTALQMLLVSMSVSKRSIPY